MAQARRRAQKLSEDLARQQAELGAAAGLPAEQLEAGRDSLQNAIDAVKRLLQKIDEQTTVFPPTNEADHD